MGEPAKAPSQAQEARRDAHQALIGVMARAAQMQLEPPARGPSRAQPVIAILLAIGLGYLWIGNPSWLREPDLTPPPQYDDASLRWCVYVTSERVEQYRHAHFKLPLTLRQTGSVPEGLDYVRIDDQHYRLTGRTGLHAVTFTSGGDVNALLGPHLGLLGFGRRPST